MIGSQLSHFNIVAKLGQGGMGEVYRATDERLGRDVAIKILPAALTADPERLARLQREARILASLAHPNIAALHDVGVRDGVHYLVMELAEGETLESRLQRGRLPQDEALGIAVQIARALEAAHERGIVHRDLKPANVVLNEQGQVKLLDFGLAKAVEDDPAESSAALLAHSPTLTAHATAAGMILGTAAYMSPEQARGKPLDKRTDVWSFGLMLFEMLTGRRVFEGETVSDTLAAVLRAEIDWTELPPGTPRALRNALRRSVERDADRRLHDVADVRIVLEEILAGVDEPAETSVAVAAAAPSRPLGWIAAAFAAGALIVLGATRFATPGATSVDERGSAPILAFRQLTLLHGAEYGGSIAPDGESFLFVKDVGGQPDIFLQRIDGRNAQNLTRTCAEPDSGPAFSPDGRRIAFRSECSGGGIFIMGATGESVRKVTDQGVDPAWSPDGKRLVVASEAPFAPWSRTTHSSLTIVDIETGRRTAISEHDGVQPAWSPNGRWIAFWGLPTDSSQRDLFVVAADGSTAGENDVIALTDDRAIDWSPVWTPDSRGLYFSSTRGGTFNVWHVPVDPQTGRRAGELRPLTVPTSWAGDLALSADGRRLIYVDRNIRQTLRRAELGPRGEWTSAGSTEVPLGTLEVDGFARFSPDGRSALLATSGLPQHLIAVEADGSQLRQLTEGDHRDRQGAWSPDGEWIVFQTDRYPDSGLGLIRADGSGLRPLGAPPFNCWNPRWSPDGRTIVISSQDGSHLVEPWADTPLATLKPLPQPGDGLNFWPHDFSRDGRRLVGIVFRGPVPEEITILDLGSGRFESIVTLREGTMVSFLDSDRKLVWSDAARIVVHDLALRTSKTLVEAPAGMSVAAVALTEGDNILSWLEVADESDIWLATIDAPAGGG